MVIGLDENTPLTRGSADSNEVGISEEEIISYVRQRRESIISNGTGRIPSNFSLRQTISHDRLTAVKTQSSANDVSDLVSQHDIISEPETTFSIETKVLFKYSVPLIITFLLQYSLTVASVFSVGRLGSDELAAVSLSSMTANISGYAIIQGVSTCLDTLCAQSYGRRDFNTVGKHFMRCNYLLLILSVPMCMLWILGSEPILLRLVENPSLCRLASKYLTTLSLGLPGFILFENAKHFLQSQGIFHASTYVLAVCAPLNAFLNYVLVWNKSIGIGFIGAPLSVVMTNWLMALMLYMYIFFVDGYQCWPQGLTFNKSNLTNWSKMINLSVPGVLMVEAEWLAFEIITFTASTFGTDVLAAQSIVSTTCVLLYQIPFAFSIAASTRIAWYIGAASKKAAILATQCTIYTSLTLGLINSTILFVFREPLASLYTNEEPIIKLASKVLIVGSVYQINDFLACATSGILRGQGRQKIGGILNLIGYYCIALPCAFLFAFHFHLELLGLWMGMIIALFIVSVLQCYFVVTGDWDHIINECVSEGILENANVPMDVHSLVPSMSSTYI